MRKKYFIFDFVFNLIFAIYLFSNLYIEYSKNIKLLVLSFYFILAIIRLIIILNIKKKKNRPIN